MIKKILLSFLLVPFLFIGLTNVEADNELPEPGMLPDSSFYFLKSWSEGLGTFLTFGDVNKSQRFLELSEKRLVEVKALAEKGSMDKVSGTMERYEEQIEKALQRVEKAKEKGSEEVDDVLERISEATLRHQRTLAEVYEKVPEEGQAGIEKAMENSMKGHERALEAVSEERKEQIKERVEEKRKELENDLEEIRGKKKDNAQSDEARESEETGEPAGSEEGSVDDGEPEERGSSVEDPDRPSQEMEEAEEREDQTSSEDTEDFPDDGETTSQDQVKLEVMTMGGGTTVPDPGEHYFEKGEEVNVEADPDPGYEFQLWEREGDAVSCDQHEKECVFEINEDSMLSAHFVERGEVTECETDSECGWVSVNCCPENAGAEWECLNEEETNIECSDDVICPQFISSKPEAECVCEGDECRSEE